MKVAQITGSNVQVEIIAVNGGWTTVRDPQTGKEFKVRNGSIAKTVEITGADTLQAARRTGREPDFLKSGNIMPVTRPKAPKVAKEPRAKLPVEQRKNGAVDAIYLQFYKPFVVERGGKKVRSMDKGDALAVQLRGMNLDDVYKFAQTTLQVSIKALQDRFSHLNPGMQRMNLGNMIRRAQREAAK